MMRILLFFVNRKVYATWLDYNSITFMGSKKEVLRNNDGLGFIWMASPLSTYKNRSNGYYGTGELHIEEGIIVGGGTIYSQGARPVLYQEGTPV